MPIDPERPIPISDSPPQPADLESRHPNPKSLESAGACRICGASSWSPLYHGPIREGRVGTLSVAPRTVLRCAGCGVGHLQAGRNVDYDSAEYRELVDGGSSPEHFHAVHDAEQADKLRVLGLAGLRGKVIADIGCGAGSFLDLVKGVSRATLGIEPTRSYHATLEAQGHAAFPYCKNVSGDWLGKVDVAVCFSVVEHVEDPVALLRDIRGLLHPGSELLLSTPNLRDWLLELLPEDYARFFYRAVHDWYFHADSLMALARAAGFSACDVQCVHRFDLANTLLWLRDRRPSGLGKLAVAPPVDAAFCRWLESSGRADYLYARLRW